jgi:ClpP class serine protease
MRTDVAQSIGRLFESGIVPTAQQLAELRASKGRISAREEGAVAASSNSPENYSVIGNTAQICIDGILSEEPDFWAWILGIEQTCYEDIRDALALAAADPTVTNVIMNVSSPGGYCDGLFETLGAIEAFAKPIRVVASQACSAAYALSAMAGPIQAAGPASGFGSVGVAMTFFVDPDQVNVTSTEAPNKRPDVTTEEGRAIVRAELDAYHELFVDAIARGRSNATGKSYTVDQVNADFGRGGELLAEAAKSAGMIDKLAKPAKRGGAKAAADDGVEEPSPAPEKVTSATDGGVAPQPEAKPSVPANQSPPSSAGQQKKGIRPMTEEELLAQHPALHAALIAKGALQGQAAERKRACAHLKLAKATGAREVAEAAIASGASTMDEDVHADYMAAAIGKRETAARQTDSDAAGEALDGAAPAAAAGAKDLGDEVADRMDAQMGKKKAS